MDPAVHVRRRPCQTGHYRGERIIILTNQKGINRGLQDREETDQDSDGQGQDSHQEDVERGEPREGLVLDRTCFIQNRVGQDREEEETVHHRERSLAPQ